MVHNCIHLPHSILRRTPEALFIVVHNSIALPYWSGGTEEVTSRYRILLHARPRSGIGGGRGPGAILLRPSVRTYVLKINILH